MKSLWNLICWLLLYCIHKIITLYRFCLYVSYHMLITMSMELQLTMCCGTCTQPLSVVKRTCTHMHCVSMRAFISKCTIIMVHLLRSQRKPCSKWVITVYLLPRSRCCLGHGVASVTVLPRSRRCLGHGVASVTVLPRSRCCLGHGVA